MILIVGSNLPATAVFHGKIGLPTSALFEGQFTDAQVYHTSISDCNNIKDYLNNFDKIYWAKSLVDEFNTYIEWFDTLCLLKSHGNVIGIDGVDPYNLKTKFNIENSDSSAIFLGCSHTAGVGLDTPTDNYVNWVSKHFKKTPLNASAGGKGNFRSFDIFNQIEFYKNQFVVLQLTDLARLRYYRDDKPMSGLNESQLYDIRNRSYIDVFNDKQLLFMMIERLDSVIKFARQADLRFVFFNLGGNPDGDNNKEKNLLRQTTEYYLSDYREYVPNILEQNIDRGNDGLHFGPLSHKIWSNRIIETIEKIY